MYERLRKPDATISNPGDHDELEAERLAAELAHLPGEQMGRSLGFDFGQVRIHADAGVARSARELGALAYTANGRDIVFGEGQYAPDTPRGRHLLAHELVHVAQQAKAPSANVIHRQPAAKPAPTVASNFAEALKFVAMRQPRFIFSALSAAPVDGARVEVKRQDHTRGGKPVTSVFTLQVVTAALGDSKLAEFEGPRDPKEVNTTRTFDMTIRVGGNTATFDPQALARKLYHEGMHMQLYVDRAVPEWTASWYLKGFKDYMAIVRASEFYEPLLADTTDFIKKKATGKAAATAEVSAKEVIERMTEEKYARDSEDERNFGTRPKASPLSTDEKKDRRSRIQKWLVIHLKGAGVPDPPVAEIGKLVGGVMALWAELDDKAPPLPLAPHMPGMYITPQVDPILPPLPAQARNEGPGG